MSVFIHLSTHVVMCGAKCTYVHLHFESIIHILIYMLHTFTHTPPNVQKETYVRISTRVIDYIPVPVHNTKALLGGGRLCRMSV